MKLFQTKDPARSIRGDVVLCALTVILLASSYWALRSVSTSVQADGTRLISVYCGFVVALTFLSRYVTGLVRTYRQRRSDRVGWPEIGLTALFCILLLVPCLGNLRIFLQSSQVSGIDTALVFVGFVFPGVELVRLLLQLTQRLRHKPDGGK